MMMMTIYGNFDQEITYISNIPNVYFNTDILS